MSVTRRQRPLVVANFAITADGKIATRRRTPAQFSSPRDKRTLLEIRAQADAVLVGRSTVSTDAMTMGLPSASLRAQRLARGQAAFPLRVIVTNSGRLSPQLRLFQVEAGPIHVFTAGQMTVRSEAALRARGARVHRQAGRAVNLAGMLRELRVRHQVRRLVCEGGAGLFGSLLEHGLVDQIHLTICPVLFGGRRAPTVTGVPGAFLPRTVQLRKLAEAVTEEGECFLQFAVRRTTGNAKGAGV